MKKTLITLVCLIASVAIADAAQKFIYRTADGAILQSTPAATVGQGDAILGSRVWSVTADGVSLGETDLLTKQVVSVDEDGNTVTNAAQCANVSELESYSTLWPITEEQRQASKSLELKEIENSFVLYYQSLGFQDKPGFDEIDVVLNSMTNELQAVKLALAGLSIDAKGKRINTLWWDDCAWHPEIVE